MKKLEAAKVPALGVTRREADLLAPGAAATLAALLRPDDAVVVIAARAPAKNTAMVVENVQMMDAVCAALTATQVAHVVYISSDAVYADSSSPLSESSCAEPASLHGVMHLAREVMLANTVTSPLCILRPTLLYGATDPHNGYGPNSFRRLAEAGKDIVLFGEGEERRDHVFVDDVAEIVLRVLMHRSSGKLNVASGTITSFREIAEGVTKISGGSGAIKSSPRKGPMPHNGYRAFDPAATSKSFPDFRYTVLADGLARTFANDQSKWPK
jgi:UDP-glucose 4-epimerase